MMATKSKREIRDTRVSPRDAMNAAVGEVNATRPRTSHAHTLADARRDRDVALANVRVAFDLAMARAAGDAARAERNAAVCYTVARQRARDTAASRRRAWERARFLDSEQVAQMHSYVGLLVANPGVQNSAPEKRTEYVAMHRMLATLLSRRGVTV